MNNKLTINARLWLARIATLWLISAIPVSSADINDRYSMNIDISGTLVSNGSCTFNAGQSLQVDFHQVKLQRTGKTTVELTDSYLQPLASTFTCTGDSYGLLQMQLTSLSGSYQTYNGTNVLGTNKGIVAIELLVNNAPQNMGEWFTVDPTSPPALQAQLVQVSNDNSSSVVSGDTFSASATLTLAFN